MCEFLYRNDSAHLLTYAYGASNQRLQMVEVGGSTTLYAWAGGSVIAEYNGVGTGMAWTKSYVYLGGRLLATDSTSGIQYHHPDRLGTRLVTNTSGGIVSENIGLPFGNTISGESSNLAGSASKKRFTSYDRSDNTRLDYAVNRHYSAAQGRFTQVDPIGMSAVSLTNPQSLNLYAYCFNDPINLVDPSGLFGEGGGSGGNPIAAIISAVIAAILAIFGGGNRVATKMGTRIERRLMRNETGSEGTWEEPDIEPGVGPVATQVKARPKLKPRQNRKKKPRNRGGEGSKTGVTVKGGAAAIAAIVTATIIGKDIRSTENSRENICADLWQLLRRESLTTTSVAATQSRIMFPIGGSTLWRFIHATFTVDGGKVLDLDWMIHIYSTSGVLKVTAGLNYRTLKSLWVAYQKYAGEPITNAEPYMDIGETNAVDFVKQGKSFSDLFTKQWMKENCPEYESYPGR